MAKEPIPIAEVEIECPHCKKWINAKIFKEKISEPEYEFRAEVSIPQPLLFDNKKKKGVKK